MWSEDIFSDTSLIKITNSEISSCKHKNFSTPDPLPGAEFSFSLLQWVLLASIFWNSKKKLSISLLSLKWSFRWCTYLIQGLSYLYQRKLYSKIKIFYCVCFVNIYISYCRSITFNNLINLMSLDWNMITTLHRKGERNSCFPKNNSCILPWSPYIEKRCGKWLNKIWYSTVF